MDILQSDNPIANFNALGIFIIVSLFFVKGTTIELAIIFAIKRMKCEHWFDTKFPKSARTPISNSRNLDDVRSNMTFRLENGQDSWLHHSKRKVNYQLIERTVLSTTGTSNKIDLFLFCIVLFLYATFTCIYFVKDMQTVNKSRFLRVNDIETSISNPSRLSKEKTNF